MKRIDLVGQKFNYLTVIGLSDIIKDAGGNFRVKWICKCICGKEKITEGSALKSGKVKSCGCKRGNVDKEIIVFKDYFGRIRRDAENRGLTFNLSSEFVSKIIKQKCYYCGCDPANEYKREGKYFQYKLVYNGIDRFDNNTGYEPENCVTCCKICNRMKTVLSYHDFISRCHQISERHKI